MKGHVNRVRNLRGREWDRYRLAVLEAANRRAPVFVYNINAPATIVFEVYPARRRRKEND